ncbi:MAG: LysR family transcriptional regulator [Gammaproteobacteria bacterium]|nr:LysR family transcriptional regulator [Gammaproteobacteria bacterium]
MEITALKAFIAVAENRSFSIAAEKIFLTQPAISKRIATLESQLGTSLFDRIGRQIQLTEAGRALLPRAQKIINEVEDSRRAIANLSNRVEGKLSIGTSHHIGLHRLPPILRQYIQRYPDVELDLHFMDSEEACRAVERGELELGIVTLPLNPDEHLKVKPLWTDSLQLVTGREHPFVGRKTVDLKALSQHPAILPATGTYTRQLVESTFAECGIAPKSVIDTNYLETIKMLVSVGMGWSILPTTMLDETIVSYRVKPFNISRQLGSVTHVRYTLSNAAVAMQEMIESSHD